MPSSYDFCGWATRNDLKCSDGRTIKRNAFKDNDGMTVPLVWNHKHDIPGNVLGHCLLENREDGVYTYGYFNDTPNGQEAKEMVKHGDITSLSIYANKLKHSGRDVIHGAIREVSLVLAGANPGAYIEEVLAHGDNSDEDSIMYTGIDEYLYHAEEDEEEDEEMPEQNKGGKTVGEVFETLNEEQKKAVYAIIGAALEDKKSGSKSDKENDDEADVKHSDESAETIGDIFNTLSEKQKEAVYAMVGAALEEGKSKEDNDVKHNLFEQGEMMNGSALAHAEEEFLSAVIADGKKYGSLRESFMAHAEDDEAYGITNIEYLFPDAKALTNTPEFIKREDDWVSKVMNGVHKTPFSRIKSVFADITEDEARAKGYIKGKRKKEEVFSLLKRTTTPTTIYKKQKLDRDDVIDITDFDVISWLKTEMRMMLNEEIARAILIGDGRLSSDDDHINQSNIRPVINDESLYTIKYDVTKGTTNAETAEAIIEGAIRARKQYKGSGNPTFFTTEDVLTDMLLLKDGIGHKLYKSEAELATELRVKEIVTVPVMEGLYDASKKAVFGIIVNLTDYNVGADKGGSINMFDDFDIDYNQMKYLMETRCSGALVKPFSAIVLRDSAVTSSAQVPNDDQGTTE